MKIELVSSVVKRVCPLCLADETHHFAKSADLLYWRCKTCHLTFLDPDNFPDREDEYAHYLTHENAVDDPGYRKFLNRLAEPLLARLPPGSSGLDYGCGPGPALAYMLREAGHEVALYDPFFAPDYGALDTTYDVVTCMETAEHFHHPAREFARLDSLLRTGGTLAIMTSFQTDDAAFPNWHYRKDPTHVVFYKRETFAHLALARGWRFDSPAKDIVFFQKR